MEFDTINYFQVHYDVTVTLRIILTGSHTFVIIYKKFMMAVEASSRDVQSAGSPLALTEKLNTGNGNSLNSAQRDYPMLAFGSLIPPRALIKMIDLLLPKPLDL